MPLSVPLFCYCLHSVICVCALPVFGHVLPANARPSALHLNVCYWQVGLISHVGRQIADGLTKRYWDGFAQPGQRIQAVFAVYRFEAAQNRSIQLSSRTSTKPSESLSTTSLPLPHLEETRFLAGSSVFVRAT